MNIDTPPQKPEQEQEHKTDKERKLKLIETLNNALIQSLEYSPDGKITDILQDQTIALDLTFRTLLSETTKYKDDRESKIQNINMALYAQKSFQNTAKTILHVKRLENKLENERTEALATYPRYPR